jgi:hypothetical protein
LRRLKLVKTKADGLLPILNHAKISHVHYLKPLRNFALGLGLLSFPVLAPRLWPKQYAKTKRGATPEEHHRILAAEKNSGRSFYYQLLWKIGAAQSRPRL